MTQPVIHRVTALDLAFEPWPWPFAVERRAEIDAHFAARQREKPIWNGRVLLGRDPVFTGERLRASYFEADFASFLAWRDWGFPDASIFNGFGMGALRACDGAFVLGHLAEVVRAHGGLGARRARRVAAQRQLADGQRGDECGDRHPGADQEDLADGQAEGLVDAGDEVGDDRLDDRLVLGRDLGQQLGAEVNADLHQVGRLLSGVVLRELGHQLRRDPGGDGLGPDLG